MIILEESKSVSMEVGAKSVVICGKTMTLVLFADSLGSLHMVCYIIVACFTVHS